MSAPGMIHAQPELRVTVRRPAARQLKQSNKARINDLIREDQSRNTLRFSDEQIVLYALAYSSDEWLLPSQIGEFAFSKIRFLQIQAAGFFFGSSTHRVYGHGAHDLTRRVESVLTKRASYLRTYGIPVYSKVNANRQKVFMMTAGAAYAYLETISSKRGMDIHTSSVKNASSSPFLTLPNELKAEICHLVLEVTGFRLLVGKQSFTAYDESTPIWASRACDALTMPPIQDLLALLSVDKVLGKMAGYLFYNKNHFQFRDMGSMKNFLHNIGPERTGQMRNVSVQYMNLSVAAAGAKLLAKSAHIQRLTLIMSATQDPAGHFTVNSSRRRFSSLTQVPGFSSLKRLRGVQQLTFHPNLNHAVLDAFLRPIVTMPWVNKELKKPKKTLKRKRESEEDAAAPSKEDAASSKEDAAPLKEEYKSPWALPEAVTGSSSS
ncbi:hypothetical protein E4T44_08829 [Aureobasidium sp. EXF-8845]|nr:hypothetical protein E4T44_08829 [Aureobasidium sp. EXF-8845]KAI4843137.1 hypothetical protein E4T45_08752 [Aureobasidium sp. EXF-8846]